MYAGLRTGLGVAGTLAEALAGALAEAFACVWLAPPAGIWSAISLHPGWHTSLGLAGALAGTLASALGGALVSLLAPALAVEEGSPPPLIHVLPFHVERSDRCDVLWLCLQ